MALTRLHRPGMGMALSVARHARRKAKGGAVESYKHPEHLEAEHYDRFAEGGRLTTEEREHISGKNFALPGRRYPIEDESHARNALARVSEYGSPEEKEEVRRKVHAKYPGMEAEGGLLEDREEQGHDVDEHHPVHAIGKMLGAKFLAHKKAQGGFIDEDRDEGEDLKTQDYPDDYEDRELEQDQDAPRLEGAPFDADEEEDRDFPRRGSRDHATHFARSYFARRALGRRG